MLRKLLTLLVLLPVCLFAQGPDCNTAFEIDNPSNFCSSLGQFTTENGDGDIVTVDTPNCWDQSDNDVWFRFIATATNVQVTVTGNTRNANIGGTLRNPQIELLREAEGPCMSVNILECFSDTQDDGLAIVSFVDLNIGDVYFIRVDGRNSTTGSFQLCAREFLSFQENDECIGGIDLGVVGQDGFCSPQNFYNNVEASESPQADCIAATFEEDVWFSFVPTNSSLFFQLFGRSDEFPQNITRPAVAIYAGECNNLVELACSQTNNNILEIFTDQVPVGRPVYVRIDGEQVGNFHFCLRSFPPIPSPESDCPDAVILCDKSSFNVQNLQSTGDIQNELTGPCVGIDQDQEQGSVWYTWRCKDPGTLTFVLNPNNPNPSEEDLDWILYELPGGFGDCDNRQALRCMLSGESQGNTPAQNAPCLLATGLREGETDVNEFAGCGIGDNNFLAPLDMETGRVYALIVNNFSQTGFGFSIEFGGTGTFEGATTDFSFALSTGEQIITCDSEVVFEDQSVSETDPIVEWNWNFGNDASEQFRSGQGPHSINFSSVGEKEFTLTVVTERGCEITETKTVELEDCCISATDLKAEAEVVNLICPGDENGRVFAKGLDGECEAGMEQYMFSRDGVLFQESPLLENFSQGQHTIFVRDCKGCVRDVDVTVGTYEEIIVDAGIDDEVDLGETTDFSGSFDPPDADIDSIIWSPMLGTFDCDTCLNPIVQPIMDQLYTLTIVDNNGCRFSDDLFITTNQIENVYEPNIFTPELSEGNDRFFLGASLAVEAVQSMRIYDRWGNLVFESFDMPINEPVAGWDGTFRGKQAEDGIYSYIAQVRFINGNVRPFKGTIHLLR